MTGNLVAVSLVQHGETQVDLPVGALNAALDSLNAEDSVDQLSALLRTAADELDVETFAVLPGGTMVDLFRCLTHKRRSLRRGVDTTCLAAVVKAVLPRGECHDCAERAPCAWHIAEELAAAFRLEMLQVVPGGNAELAVAAAG